ncbi:MAG: xanthine dehydrogenase family protein molybdopterin-binding subunit [Dehalococcoidia bacterium]
MTQTAEPTRQFSVIGTRPIRPDGLEKVTGRARYSADINLPGMLYGKILRSPHAHARIKSIDLSGALAMPGVLAAVSGKDLPAVSGKLVDQSENAFHNLKFMGENCLADEKARYVGHAIAAVAATSPHIAEQALKLIKVDYEVLRPVMTAADSMAENAPVIIEDLVPEATATRRAGGLRSDGDRRHNTNIANRFVFQTGDPANGFEAADIVLEREYLTSAVHQGYIEPQSATAWWAQDGSLTIWCSSQGQFAMRDLTASLLKLPASKVRVIPMEIGGGFGAKTLVYLEPVAALLSRKTGRPVKIQLQRAEVFQSAGPTSGASMRAKVGVRNDGRITAADATLAFEAGAYPGSPVAPGTQCMFAPYDIPDQRVEGLDVLINAPKVSAYRAPGSPAAAFASETLLDELAEKLGLDPIEFRMRNAAHEGTRRVNNVAYGPIGFIQCLEAARDSDHYRSPLVGANRGRGVAAGFWTNGTGPASAVASVNTDGRISLVEGSPDIGGSRATAAMHVAEVLGIPVADITPTVGDTDAIGYTSTTGGSSATFKTGWACYEAANDIKRQMTARAAAYWGVEAGEVAFAGGVFSNLKEAGKELTFKKLAGMQMETGGPIVGRAAVMPRGAGPSFAVHVVDVEVDPDTGKVQILRYTAVQDVGKAIHPSYVEGQIQGGVAQGVGWALHEEYRFDPSGRMLNPTFLDYRMPTTLDVPLIETILVEVPNPGHPYGARGVGEVPIVPPMAAIANAVGRATGTRLRQLPMSPGRVLDAILAKQAAG